MPELHPSSPTFPELKKERPHKDIRQAAWVEYQKRIEKGYTADQQACFMAGMATMWRLIGLDPHPLFTYGPDSLPRELES